MMPMMLRQFQLLRPIAEGGMGVVYRAFDTTLEREVAVKLMKSELADDKEVVEGFYREARACACLNHANIIHIYTFDELQDMRYLVMEVADNGSLDGRIEDHGALEELFVLDVGIKMASALDCAPGRRSKWGSASCRVGFTSAARALSIEIEKIWPAHGRGTPAPTRYSPTPRLHRL